MTLKQKIVFGWAIAGISVLFTSALLRMAAYFSAALDYSFTWRHWLVLVLWCIFMLTTEGYRGFQKQFSPMVAARAMYLVKKDSKFVDALLAPIFCMGYFHATRRRLIRTWLLTIAIVGLVILIGQLKQPWRGIIDLGVMLGLSYGLITIYYFTIKYLREPKTTSDPQVN